MRHLVFTEEAVNTRQMLLDFLAEIHSPFVAEQVDAEVDNCLRRLLTLPFLFPQTETKQFGLVRKAIIRNLTLIFYRVSGDQIQILSICDARTDWA